VLVLVFIIYYHYVRQETNPNKKRRLQIILLAMITFLIFTNVLFFLSNPAAEVDDRNNSTQTVSVTRTDPGSLGNVTSSVSNSESSSIPPEGTATPAPDLVDLLDPRLVIIALAFLFVTFYYIRKSLVAPGDEGTDSQEYEITEKRREQLNLKNQIVKQYLSASNDLEMLGADNSLEATTREFEHDANKKFGRKRPVVKDNLKELTRVYEIAKFSDQELTELHAKRAKHTSAEISNVMFPQKSKKGEMKKKELKDQELDEQEEGN